MTIVYFVAGGLALGVLLALVITFFETRRKPKIVLTLERWFIRVKTAEPPPLKTVITPKPPPPPKVSPPSYPSGNPRKRSKPGRVTPKGTQPGRSR